MRKETNNEMDLLLRRLSRRPGVPASDGDSRNDSDHLDADELSSYAENAVPAAARARYTEHLAECSRCRELVVQLSASVPVVAVRETVTAAELSGLRKFLASFFSPMVLRYAVPALGLIIVAAIGFVVLRSNRERESMARLDGNMQSASAPVQSEQPTSSTFNDSSARTASPLQGDTAARKPEESKETQPAATPKPDQIDGADLNAARRRDEPAPVTERQAVANAEPPAPAAPKATVDEMRVEIEGRKAEADRAASLELAKKAAKDVGREQETKNEVAAARRPATGTAAAPQAGGATSTFSVAEQDKDDGVIRTAGGRRFRKQSGAWVDTAYNSGSRIVNVARDSEQYRALVADEPTIKEIADQLDGTIYLVWKGSTYRIR